MKYSFIIPVYNRPDEVDELLDSLTRQECRDFEVVVVEDGSAVPCRDVCDRYADRLDLHYYNKENSGPGQSRNYGAERAQGEYLIVLDSDVVLPPGYLSAVDAELAERDCDAFGGPDSAHPSFTPVQKAISYSMTSFFTTGGIRGGKKKLDKFYPRSFNMGIRRDVYERLGGFSRMRFGEDIDFSIRIFKAGCRCRLFPAAWVWHKRRTDFRKFWRQVYNSGIARINLYKKYPESLKLVHLLPMVFTVGVVGGDGSGGSRGMGGLPADHRRIMAHGVGTGSAGALFAHHLHRRHPLGAQSARGCAQHRLGLHPAHGLWLWLPLGVVEALCVWQERVQCLRKNLL